MREERMLRWSVSLFQMAGLIKMTAIMHCQIAAEGRDGGLVREGSDESKAKRTVSGKYEVEGGMPGGQAFLPCLQCELLTRNAQEGEESSPPTSLKEERFYFIRIAEECCC